MISGSAVRTTLVDSKGQPLYTNRLIHEDSPYLRQHAHNPVDWYPWCEEAFARAKAENKPVFLSIGYSTCHWCHVMEHESFDNEAIAAYLNEHFVSIKLDREQRPDLDDIYMTGVQLMSGQGGWPMSNFLTPEGQPFFAGTYYPAAGFRALLERISEVWTTRQQDVLEQAAKTSEAIAQYTAARSISKSLPEDLHQQAADELLSRFDETHGGFGGAPKFPNESMLWLGLTLADRYQRDDLRQMVCHTLDKMAAGGIYDQVGGGFHRYTVDQHWLTPHFEKMLYNQGQLIRVYAEAWRQTRKPAYSRVVRETIAYLLRDMRRSDGCFWSATDADSEGEEGRFFVWTPAELATVLSDGQFALVMDLYGVTENGNFEGRNILHTEGSLEDYGEQVNRPVGELEAELEQVRQKLYEFREQRIHPLCDEKIILSWNSLIVTALAEASAAFAEPEWLDLAESTMRRLLAVLKTPAGLWRISLHDTVSVAANQEDYAYTLEAVMSLYVQSGKTLWLTHARELAREMSDLFEDKQEGGFYLSRQDEATPLITRPRSPMDGAMASGNSVALSGLL
ncbi:MAG: thioredoxin domain-containing protein, partial [Pseudomonadales bacterium]|nr:thioredoxin domain-containing protein [Pseudomonadales bacterium]